MIEKTAQVKATPAAQRVLNTDPRVLRWREIEDGEVFEFDYVDTTVSSIYRVSARDIGIVELC